MYITLYLQSKIVILEEMPMVSWHNHVQLILEEMPMVSWHMLYSLTPLNKVYKHEGLAACIVV